MNRDWNDFKALNGNIAGAREAFENACETLFRKKNPDRHVSQVKVKSGDGGIDIFIGELGVEPITVIQCKFFLDAFNESQKSQIRKSFKTAVLSKRFQLKEWILCIPRVIDIDENSWWFDWKHKQIKEYSKAVDFIRIFNGNELIDLYREFDLYNSIFRIDESTKISEIHSAVVPKKTLDSHTQDNPNIILFNNYTQSCEPYYLQREVDEVFINSLKLNNIWIYGKSGVGKTVLINRNLIKEAFEYCFCDLSPVNVQSSDQVIEELICKVEERFDTERNFGISNKIKQLAQILCASNKKQLVFVIDELSVTNNEILKNIATDLMNLVVYYNNSYPIINLKFVVSTISDPKNIIENRSKASEYFQYVDCDPWAKGIDDLFVNLTGALNIDLDNNKNMILSACQNSPRILKSVLRKIMSLVIISNETVTKATKLTIDEFV